MKLKPKIITRFVMVGGLLGFLFADLFPTNLFDIWPLLVSIILVLIIIGVVFKDTLVWLVGGSLIMFTVIFWLSSNLILRHQPPADFKNQSEIEGVISEKPALDDKQKVVLKVENYWILVNLPRYPEYHYGQKLKISGKLEEPVIFPDFNYRNYLKGRQIYLVINRVDNIEVVGEAGSKVKSWLFAVSNSFESALNKSLPEPEAAFAAGLILGSKRGLPDSLILDMQNSGTSHLVAISGYNITVILVALSLLLLPLGRRLSFPLSVLIIAGFVILSGASASVVRGAIVGLLVILARSIDRRANQTNILLLSAIIILLFNPLMMLYDYGFLLSFSAFSGLVYIAPLLNHQFSKNKLLSRTPEIITNPLKETLAAQIMSLPLLLFAFGKFSLVAPLTNILILPFVPAAMAFVFVTGFLGSIYLPLGVVAGYVNWILLKYPLIIINYFGRLPFSAIDFGKNYLWLVLLSYIFIGLIIFFKRGRVSGDGKGH